MKVLEKPIPKVNHLLHNSIIALQTKPRLRTLVEISDLCDLTQSSDFFSTISKHYQSDDFQKVACTYMTFEEIAKGSEIFQIGDPSTSMYIILQGSVTLKLPSKLMNNISVPKEFQAIIKGLKAFPKRKESEIEEGEEEVIRKAFVASIEKDLKLVESIAECKAHNITEVLSNGESFGVVGMLTGRPRSHNAVANEKVALAVISKSVFKTIVSAYLEKKHYDRIDFLHGISLFSTWSRAAISKLLESFTTITYHRNQKVFKEGEEAGFLIFIMSGELKLTKIQCLANEAERPLSSEIAPLRNGKVKKTGKLQEMQLVVKGKNQIIGIDNIGENLRPYSCYCDSSRCEVLTIPRQIFVEKVSRPENSAYLNSKKINERVWLNERITEIKKAEYKFERENYEKKENRISRKNESPPIVFKYRDATAERLLTARIVAHTRRFSSDSKRKSYTLPQTPKKEKIKRLPPPNFLISYRKKRLEESPDFREPTHSC